MEKAMSEFLSGLYVEDIDDKYSRLTGALTYKSDLLDCIIWIPEGFVTDFASVPRVPIAYWFYGGRVHREAVLHDYLYRIDSDPVVPFMTANKVFLEAMFSRNKSPTIAYPMYAGVVVGGCFSYHKHNVLDSVEELKK